ncbi:MAG: ATP-dependent DNA helicase RecG [Anaerolineae bacterium]|nr:ATP-dependent DNA helicase RecG [Anaerolineae bacterium]
MPSALETLVKILKLEQDTGYQNKAVIGGLKSFALHWVPDAHAQARKPEHHALVDELAEHLNSYGDLDIVEQRHEAIKYMLGRITGRIPAPADPTLATPPSAQPPAQPSAPPVKAQTETSPASEKPRQPVPKPAMPKAAPRREEQPRRPVPRPIIIDEQPSVYDAAEAARAIEARNTPPPSPQETLGLLPGDKSLLPESEPNQAEMTLRAVTVIRQEPPRVAPPPRRKRSPHDPDRDAHILRGIKAPISTVSGIGPKIAEKLQQIGIYTIEDLLYCFPRRYDDYTQMPPLNKLKPGQTITAAGTVRNTAVIKGKRNVDVLKVTIDDGAGTLNVSFFNQPYLRSKLERGTQVVFSGKTDLFLGQIVMNNPEWELLEREALHTRAIIPVYPLTKGLSAHNMRKFARAVIDQWASQLPDYMPEAVLERTDLVDLGWAIQQMHFPSSMDMLEHARRRLVFDELLLLQLGVLRNRRDWQNVPGEALTVTDEWLNAFAATLPYALTGAQIRAIQAIREDMARDIPMNRLLQGDVGAGKTVVAATAMAIAVASGHQAAIMAPTSILAEQHYRSLSRLLQNSPGGENINVKLLTGSTSASERADILWGLGEGSVHVIIGTHALIEDEVNFWRLGLAVIDEQHRFGVEQRGRLRGKGTNPHILVMTATPIPRTLALTMYADLDLAILDEMPPGRTPIDTKVLYPKERERAYSFIDSQVKKGRQAFIVYPLVEASESEAMEHVRSAVDEFNRLSGDVFPHLRLGLLHGKLSPAEKDAVMLAFSQGELDVLVSTSVIEVGIDVPNASVILIEGANRFGLAQLHQFRGRVGRGQHPSFCLLLADDGDMNNMRLQAMESTTDGFKLAEIDWEMRGAGELLGTRQSGGKARLGDYMNVQIVENAQLEAKALYEEDPDLARPEHAPLRERLNLRYGSEANEVS